MLILYVTCQNFPVNDLRAARARASGKARAEDGRVVIDGEVAQIIKALGYGAAPNPDAQIGYSRKVDGEAVVKKCGYSNC